MLWDEQSDQKLDLYLERHLLGLEDFTLYYKSLDYNKLALILNFHDLDLIKLKADQALDGKLFNNECWWNENIEKYIQLKDFDSGWNEVKFASFVTTGDAYPDQDNSTGVDGTVDVKNGVSRDFDKPKSRSDVAPDTVTRLSPRVAHGTDSKGRGSDLVEESVSVKLGKNAAKGNSVEPNRGKLENVIDGGRISHKLELDENKNHFLQSTTNGIISDTFKNSKIKLENNDQSFSTKPKTNRRVSLDLMQTNYCLDLKSLNTVSNPTLINVNVDPIKFTIKSLAMIKPEAVNALPSKGVLNKTSISLNTNKTRRTSFMAEVLPDYIKDQISSHNTNEDDRMFEIDSSEMRSHESTHTIKQSPELLAKVSSSAIEELEYVPTSSRFQNLLSTSQYLSSNKTPKKLLSSSPTSPISEIPNDNEYILPHVITRYYELQTEGSQEREEFLKALNLDDDLGLTYEDNDEDSNDEYKDNGDDAEDEYLF